MEAGSQGQGRGARRLWAPLCARDLPSSTLRLLPGPWAPNRASDLPGYGELHFRTPENSSKPLRMRGRPPGWGGIPSWAFVLGCGGVRGSPLRPPPTL